MNNIPISYLKRPVTQFIPCCVVCDPFDFAETSLSKIDMVGMLYNGV